MHDDLTPDESATLSDAAWAAIYGASFMAGVALTCGWMVRAGWAIAHNPAAWRFLTGH